MQEAGDLAFARAAVAAIRDRFVSGSDEELLADAALLEEIGRVVDGLRAKAAWQLEWRSRPLLGEERLSFQQGARDGVELVQLTTGVGMAEARRRIGIGTALAPTTALGIETGPGQHGEVAASVLRGAIGVDAARHLFDLWKQTHRRADPTSLAEAMTQLVDIASRTDEQGLRDAIGHYGEALDPDGQEPRERHQRRQRTFRFGSTLADGTTSARIVFTPEDLALMKEYLQSRRRSIPLIRTDPASDATDETHGPDWRECAPDGEPGRERAQQDYDTLLDAVRLAAKAESDGHAPTVTTHQVIVTVTARDLEARSGRAWTPGAMAGLPMPVVERMICDGETRLQVTGAKGETLYLSKTSRLFSPAQKVALLAASGGTCQYPGCDVPHPYLDAHHVAWWNRDDGPTDIDNAILLCSYHHHLIHARSSPVEIRRWQGDLSVVPRSWSGEPVPEQRQQHAPPLERRHRGRRRRRPATRTARSPAAAEP